MELVGLKVSIEADTSAIKSAFADLSQLMSDFNNQIKAIVSSGVFKQITDEQLKSAQASKDLASAELTLAKSMNETLKSKLAQLKIDKEIEASEARKVVSKRREKDAYSELVSARNDNVRSMYNEFAEMKKNGATLEDFTKKHQNLIDTYNKEQQELKDLESLFGRNQRNVGNYAGSFNALNNSIMQISRELPAFANGLQTGLSGISNNIGPLQDALKGIIDKNKELKAEGKPTVSVLGELAGAMFNWTTAISVATLLLVEYGPALWDSISGAKEKKEALEALKKKQDEYNNSLNQSARSMGEEISQTTQLVSLIQKKNTKLSDRNLAYKKLQDIYPDVLGNMSLEQASALGLSNVLRNNLIPAIKEASRVKYLSAQLDKSMADMFEAESKRAIAESDLKANAGAIKDLNKQTEEQYNSIVNTGKANMYLLSTMKSLDNKIKPIQEAFKQASEEANRSAEAVSHFTNELAKVESNKLAKNLLGAGQKNVEKESEASAKRLAKKQESDSNKAKKEYEKQQEEFRKLMIKVSNNLRKTQEEELDKTNEDLEKLLNKDLDKNRPILRAIEFDYYIKADEKKMLELNKNFIEDLDKALQTLTQDSLIALGEGIGSMIAGDMGLGGVLKNIGGLVADFVVQVGKMLIQMGIEMSGIKTAIQSLITNPYLAIAAGIGAVAVGTAMKKKLSNQKIRPFADGGIVSGRTNALIGEYAGARNNPEVVAPLNKLEGILQGMNLGGNNVVVLESVIKGSDLVLLQQRENRRKK